MGTLDGLLVIAIEQAVAAPLCTQKLADAGARVIKIERAGGETARHYDQSVHGMSSYFTWLNRGKESAVLDLKQAQDLRLLRSALKSADVLVQNLAPGSMARLGLGTDVLKAEYPHLISVSITGYGQDTPYAGMKAYDMLVQAEAGVCAVTGTPDTPSKVGIPIADIMTGMNAHAAILEALIARQISGRGTDIEISMFDTLAETMTVPLLHYIHDGSDTGRHGLHHATIYPYRPFQCIDGAVVIAIQTNGQFRDLCRHVLDRPDLADQADFSTNPERSANRSQLDQELEPIFASMTVETAMDRLRTAGIAFGRYSTVADVADHPALRTTRVVLPDGSVAQLPCPAGQLPLNSPQTIPTLGQHTDQIRKEFG